MLKYLTKGSKVNTKPIPKRKYPKIKCDVCGVSVAKPQILNHMKKHPNSLATKQNKIQKMLKKRNLDEISDSSSSLKPLSKRRKILNIDLVRDKQKNAPKPKKIIKKRIKNPNYSHTNQRSSYTNKKKAYFVQLYLDLSKEQPALKYESFCDDNNLPHGTFSGWMAQKDKILEYLDEKKYVKKMRKSLKWLKKQKKAKYEKEELKLYGLLISRRAEGLVVNGLYLKTKMKKFVNEYEVGISTEEKTERQKFSASNGWFANFKKRYE